MLTPIFVIVGIILGVLCGTKFFNAWIQGRLCSRRDKTIAGPRYVSVGDKDKTFEEDENRGERFSEKEALTGDSQEGDSTPRKDYEELHRSRSGPGWTTLLRSPLSFGTGGSQYTPVVQGDDHNTPTDRRSRRFAHETKKEANTSRGKVHSPSAPTEYTYSGASSQDDGSAKGDNEDDDFYVQARSVVPNSPADLTRHKSIRQRILEKIQQGFSPRSKREKSRQRGTPQLEEGLLLKDTADSSMDEQSPLKRVRSKLGSGRAGRHGRAISDFSVMASEIQTPGKAHVSLHGLAGREVERIDSTESFRSATPRKFDNDKYTALPERKIRASRTRSVQASPTKLSYPKEPSTPLRRTYSDAQVLPVSPPLLESPQLHSALFFGSRNATPMSTTLHTLDSDSPISPMKSQRKLVKSGRAYPESSPFGRMDSKHGEIESTLSPTRRAPSGPRQANKLHSPKKSSSVRSDANHSSPSQAPVGMKEKPLPSTPARQRTVHRPSSTPTRSRIRPPSSTSSWTPTGSQGLVHSPSSPKERFEARRSALDKVSAIVSKSYSSRDLNGMQRPSSPSMFGAQANDVSSDRLGIVSEEACLLPGIEQRLNE